MMFKVGDRVKVLPRSGGYWTGVRPGMVGTIIKVEDNSYLPIIVTLDDTSKDHCFYPEDFEVITKKKSSNLYWVF